MLKRLTIVCMFLFLGNLFASGHGIYLKTHQGIKKDISIVESQIYTVLENSGYEMLFKGDLKTPDFVRLEKSEHCGFNAKLIIFTSTKYTKILTEVDNKYLIGAFLRVGIYETPNGVEVNIVDPETIGRIIFNDLYENGKEGEYKKNIEKIAKFKNELLNVLHSVKLGKEVSIPMEPVRDDEDLAESSKDMFMMVGEMTFFNDEDQFPVIYSTTKSTMEVRNMIDENLKIFEPVQDDIDYRWSPNSAEDLKWKIISETKSADGKAILIGLTRPRTEAVSFNVAGAARENDVNSCPGIDHAASYPIEVLIISKDGKTNIYTQREMFRMDMYFWDAGMSAFMDHMNMPGILDEALRRAILGNNYSDN